MARLLNKSPEAYLQEKSTFLRELKVFHDQRGTSFKRIPNINGKEVDLYHLYWVVTAHGGWEKVNGRNAWEEFLEGFDLGESTANAGLALKQIYLRYLDSYEKYHFLGEEEDREDDWYNDEEDSRSRRQKAQKIHASVPLTYNHGQHLINDTLRGYYGFSTNVYRRTDYDRLTLSLSSPLPNEQDFAINTCTLLSNEGKHTLKLAKCERLLDHLLSHAGVYNDESYRLYMENQYLESRNYDLFSFWKDVCHLDSVRQLILRCEDQQLRPRRRRRDKSPPSSNSSSDSEDIIALGSPKQRLCAVRKRAKTEIEEAKPDSPSMFAIGRLGGTQELTGQRVRQIATIIRNLSFEEENAQIIAKSMTCLRFCLLCASSKWNNLNQMGFDILSNIAGDLVLDDSFCDRTHLTEILLSTIISGISSSDRFQVISSLDVLNKLCLTSRNEHYIENLLGSGVYAQLISYLSLHDIHLLISTLECLYSLSSLGEVPCNSISRISGAVDSLVSLTTAEAQSYGPKACVLMRVVEYVPGGASATVKGQMPTIKAPTKPPHPQMATLTNVRPQQQHLLRAPQTTIRTVTPLPKQQQVVQLAQGGGVVKIHSAMPLGVRHALPQGQQQRLTQIAQAVHPQQQTMPPQQTLKQQIPAVISVQKTLSSAASSPPVRTALQITPQQQVQLPPSQESSSQAPQLRSQQVSLRINNDESNRQLCLSWLRATYETCPGSHIEQFIMYKQYLASMHKMGREDVISDQHHVVCVRTLFGGDVGPNPRVIMPGGKTERHFEGVKVRAVPQPLRLPETTSQQQGGVVKTINHSTTRGTPTPPPSNVPVPPQSPILTNLLHRKSPDLKAQQQVRLSESPENGSTVLDGLLPKDNRQSSEEPKGNGMLANLLEQKVEESSSVNGSVQITTTNGLMGEEEILTRKRSVLSAEQPPAKKILLTNGGGGPISLDGLCDKDEGTPLLMNSSGQIIVSSHKQQQQILVPQNRVLPPGARIVSSSSSGCGVEGGASTVQQPILMKTPGLTNGGGSITPPPSQQPNQKTIIILPYSGQNAASNTSSSSVTNGTSTHAASNGQFVVSASSNGPAPSSVPSTASSTPPPPPSVLQEVVVKPNPACPFLCEWSGCMKAFKTPKEVENHAIKAHCPVELDDIPCLWSRCDGMKRKRFSLMTHIQDRHCHPQLMKLMAVRRVQLAQNGKSDVPLPPAPPPHPGYAPNAAYHAIKRHALEFVSPKEMAMRDEKEGPVTKSIRLTSSLILKNLVIYSALGKSKLRAYESHLSTVALSNVESSRTMSQIIFDMSERDQKS